MEELTETKETKKAPLVPRAIAPVMATSRTSPAKPNTITSALRSLDAGDFHTASELFDEMEEKDFHLASVMQTRAASVGGLEMTITPASEDERDHEIAEEVSNIFWSIQNIYTTLTDILIAGLGYGVALGEIYWAMKNGRVEIDKIAVRDCRWLRYEDLNDPTKLVEFPRWVTMQEPHGIKLDPKRFLHFTPLAGRRHPVRAGLYRGLVWLWLFGNYTIKDWLSFNELYGTPMRIGKYGSSASDEEKKAVAAAVKSLGADAAAVIDEHSEIKFEHLSATGKAPYAKTMAFFDAQKSKRVLGQTLTTEQGDVGSQALGKVHDEVRRDITVADAKRLAEVINRDVIRPLVDYNFGPQKSYPTLVLQTDEAPDVSATLAHVTAMTNLGLDVSEQWIREATGIPAPDADEKEAKKQADDTAEDSREDNDNADDTDSQVTESRIAANSAITPVNGVHPAQKRANDLVDTITEQTEETYFDLIDTTALSLDDNGDGDELTDAELEESGFVSSIENLLWTAQILGEETVRNEADEEERLHTTANSRLAANAITITDTPEKIITPVDAADYWTNVYGYTPDDFAAMDHRIKLTAFRVAKLENKEVINRLRNLFKTALTEDKSGLLTFRKWYDAALSESADAGLESSPFIDKAHAKTVFRTNIQTAFNAGRYNAMTKSDFVKRMFPHWRMSFVNDESQSDICKSLMAANPVLPVDDPYWKSHWPPFHFSCRTTVVGVSKYDTKYKPTAAPVGIEYDEKFHGNPALAVGAGFFN